MIDLILSKRTISAGERIRGVVEHLGPDDRLRALLAVMVAELVALPQVERETETLLAQNVLQQELRQSIEAAAARQAARIGNRC